MHANVYICISPHLAPGRHFRRRGKPPSFEGLFQGDGEDAVGLEGYGHHLRVRLPLGASFWGAGSWAVGESRNPIIPRGKPIFGDRGIIPICGGRGIIPIFQVWFLERFF